MAKPSLVVWTIGDSINKSAGLMRKHHPQKMSFTNGIASRKRAHTRPCLFFKAKCACMYVCIHICMYVMYVLDVTHTCMYVCNVCIGRNTYVYTYIHTFICIDVSNTFGKTIKSPQAAAAKQEEEEQEKKKKK